MVKVFIQNSFSITGRGIIIFIQHNQQGLLKGTILYSNKNNLSWEVISRILFDHALDKQTIFLGETVNYMNLSFESLEKKENSIQNILDDEKRGIFQYMIKPIGHDRKPDDNEELEMKTTAKTV